MSDDVRDIPASKLVHELQQCPDVEVIRDVLAKLYSAQAPSEAQPVVVPTLRIRTQHLLWRLIAMLTPANAPGESAPSSHDLPWTIMPWAIVRGDAADGDDETFTILRVAPTEEAARRGMKRLVNLKERPLRVVRLS